MKKCKINECPLIKRIEVPYSGNTKAEIVVVGEAPGFEEENNGRPFAGRAGKKIKSLIANAGLNWQEMFITNAARCLIDKKKMGTKDITRVLAYCRKKLVFAIKEIKPKLIICLGDYALRQIIKKSGITKMRGRWLFSQEFDCWVMPTFHPAYILRNEAFQPLLEQDLDEIASFVKNKYLPKAEEDEVAYKEVQSIAKIINDDSVKKISIDSETEGKDFLSPNWVLLSYSISTEKGNGFHIQLHEECNASSADFVISVMRLIGKKRVLTEVGIRRSENFNQKISELKALLESNIKKRMMTNYELHSFYQLFSRLKMKVPKIRNYVMDIQVAANLIEENMFRMASLEMLQRSFTDYSADYNRVFELEHDKADMLSVPRKELVKYACADADVTNRAAEKLTSILKKPENERIANYFVKFSMPVVTKTIYTLEKNGTYIDMKKLPVVKREVETLMEEANKKALSLITTSIKNKHKGNLALTRGDLVRDVLFSSKGFNLDPLRKTKGGDDWAIDKETRMLLSEKEGVSDEAKEFIKLYDEFSEYHTLHSRYLKGFEKHIKPDGRIHSNISITQARTGRLASANPNMMNNPKRSKAANLIRQLIAAPPGYILMAADQEQSELRWCAELTRDPEMMRVFKNNEDIHENTAKSLSSTPWEKMSDKERKKARLHAKPVNFGLLYGMSPEGFVRYAKKEYGITISLETAKEWIASFFGKYKKIRVYHEKTIDFCRQFGYVESPLGRRRRLPEINSTDGYLRGEAERQAVNHPIQNPSSDVVLMASNTLIDEDYPYDDFRLSEFIHDELVFEVREDLELSFYAKRIKLAMENPPLKRDFDLTMKVPLLASIKIGKNLAEMHSA